MPKDTREARRYPSDLSDTEWRLLEPLLARRSRLGRPFKGPRRAGPVNRRLGRRAASSRSNIAFFISRWFAHVVLGTQ